MSNIVSRTWIPNRGPIWSGWRSAVGRLPIGLAVAVAVFGSLAMVSAQSYAPIHSSPVVQIELLNRPVFTRKTTLRVQDIAIISGGSESMRRKIAGLDLDQLDKVGTQLRYNHKQLFYRIRLAKISEADFQIVGPESIDIYTVDPQAMADAIASRSLRALAARWKVSENTVQFSVLPSHIQLFLSTQCHPDQCQWAIRYPEVPIADQLQHLEVELTPPVGQTVSLSLPYRYLPDAANVIQPVQFRMTEPAGYNTAGSTNDARNFDPAVTQAGSFPLDRLPSAEPAQNFPVDNPMYRDPLSQSPPANGWRPPTESTSTFPADLPAALPTDRSNRQGGPGGSAPKELVIRHNQTVKLIVKAGAVTLTLRNGQALQKGAIGDVIEVRNPKNPRAKLWGRVIDGQTVEVIN